MLEHILGETWLVLLLALVFGGFFWLTLYIFDVAYPSGERLWMTGRRWLAVIIPITYAAGVLFILEAVRFYTGAVCCSISFTVRRIERIAL